MRRRFWLSRHSAESTGVGVVHDVLPHLQRHLVGRDVYLSSRGFVSTNSKGWRRHVGLVGGVEARADDAEHWVVEVEATEEYEARQREVVGGVTTGRQDADQVRLEIAQRLTSLAAERILNPSGGYGMARIHAETAQRMQPSQTVYVTDNGTVTAIPSPHSPVVGTFVRMNGDSAVVALDGGGAVTMQVGRTATAGDVAATRRAGIDAVATSWSRGLLRSLASSFTAAARTAESFMSNIVTAGRSLDEAQAAYRSVLNEAQTTPQSVEDVIARLQGATMSGTMRFGDARVEVSNISYTNNVDMATARSTSPVPLGRTTGTYTANIPIILGNDLDLTVMMQRQQRELVTAARRRQDEAVAQALQAHRPVVFPVDDPDADEHTRRICDLVERIGREAAQRYLGDPICVDPQTGHIVEAERLRIEEGITAALRQRLDGDIRLVVDREMAGGQLQSHIVGSTTGERRWDNVYDWNPSQGVVAAPLTGTVRLTNTSSEAYVIAPGALAVSAAPGAPTTWYNTDETTLPPGGVVDVPVHSVTTSSSEPLTHVHSALPGVVATPTCVQPVLCSTLDEVRSAFTSAPRTYTVDAVEVSPDPACTKWLPRLLPWLSSEVTADDAELRGLDDEIAASGQQIVLVYVVERRALRVETRKEWLEAGGGRMAWSTIQDRAATSAP